MTTHEHVSSASVAGREDSRPVVVELFAGAGGLSLGFEQAGFDIAAAVEYDPIHAATHKLNFPHGATMCADVRRMSGDDIRAAAGLGRRAVDAVVGGPPCQGFSLIGHRILEDPRNELVFHFLRIVLELKPRVFVMENVAGMASGTHTHLLNELIDRFRRAGYKVRLPYRILNAANYGVPQDRRRLFLIGSRSDTRVLTYPEATTAARGGGDAQRDFDLRLCPGVADAIGDLPDIEDNEALFETDELRCRLRGGSVYAKTLRGDVDDPNDFGYRRERDAEVLTGCLRARHTELSRSRFAATEPGTTEPVSRFFKLASGGVCNTIRAGTATDRGAFTAPRPVHPNHPRCITVREAARLHSYPDWFRFHRTIWHGFRQIGNSVPPLLARAVAAQAMNALGETPRRSRTIIKMGDPRLAAFDMREAAAYFGVDPRVIAPRKRLAAETG